MSDGRRTRSEVDAATTARPPARRGRASGHAATFLELVKFEHSIFALPYAYIGALYGAATVAWRCSRRSRAGRRRRRPWVTRRRAGRRWSALALDHRRHGRRARSFAFVVNRAVDKEIDARNPRTAGRADSRGARQGVGAVALLGGRARRRTSSRVWQLAPITHWLWPIPLAAFVVYPYLKRFTWLCHYWLGLCLGLAPPGGWAAVGGPLSDPAPWVFGLAVLLWTAGFDIIYATQDVECDVRDGIHSMPADFGVASALTADARSSTCSPLRCCSLLGGWLVGAGWPCYVGRRDRRQRCCATRTASSARRPLARRTPRSSR